jgi:2-desacetyl-2-hydroxyethyl bacteriochlorophyllide A dehydrogenase
MHGLWLENERLTFRTDLADLDPAPGWALVRLRMAGICSTDLEMVKAYYPFAGVPGHEFVGQVVGVGQEIDRHWVGRRVVGEINLACGECPACRSGLGTHCTTRSVLGLINANGVFAEFVVIPVENLHTIPDEVSDEAAVFTEPLAAALEILQQGAVRPSDRVLLVGAGRLGLLIAQVLALIGCDLQVVARRPEPQRLLARWGIPATLPDQVSAGSFDVAIEATGVSQGFDLARRALRPRGTMVLKSTYSGAITVNFSSIVVDELTLLGSRCGPFEPAIRLLANQKVNPTPLIVGSYRLAQGIEAFEKAAQPGILKIVLTP